MQGVVNNNGNAKSNNNSRQRYYYVKVAKPDLFYKDRHKYDNWIIQLNTYLMFNKVKDNKKTAFAFTFIRGKAYYWLKPYFKEWYANKCNISRIVRNFNRFKQESNKYFRSTND